MSAQYESTVKRMQHGFAARNGLFAALISGKGYTGIDQVFERPYGGYLATFAQGCNFTPRYKENEIVDGLGKDWRGIEGIRVKKYNSMIATHAPVDCIAALQEKYPERFANWTNIQSIKIEQSEAAHAHGGQQIKRPITAIGAQMSTRYVAAVQLLDREVLIDQFHACNLGRAHVWQLADKVECHRSPECDEKGSWYTRVSIVFTDGKTFVEELPASESIGHLLPSHKILEKWRMLTAQVMDKDTVQEVEGRVLNLENVLDIASISRLLDREVCGVLDDDRKQS